MKQTIRGIFALIVGLIIGVAYLCKYFPLDPSRFFSILAVWSYTGWMFAGLAILYGLCEIFIGSDLE